MRETLRLSAALGCTLAAALAITAAPALGAKSPLRSHGDLLKLNANQSSNWFGYNQGTLEKGNKLFNSISGDWTVPTATQHRKGQAESSSDWIGIGGGCVDSGCAVTDNTLIQTGTEQDVNANGKASYSAWWEVIPAPSISVSLPVHPGDRMHADISEVVPNSNVWTITLKNVTRNKTFTQTVPYSSTHLTAEWIEETPLLIGTDAGFAALPNLTNPAFDLAKTNGANAALTPAEKMLLTDSNGKVIGAPSNPDAQHDGFAACTWRSTC
jgi:hypothetical protein